MLNTKSDKLLNDIFIFISFFLGFFLVILPYQKIFFIFKIYNILSIVYLLLIIFFYETKKKLFISNQSYIYFIVIAVVFFPLLFFNISDEAKLINSLLKIINIYVLLTLMFFIFLNNLTSYFIKGIICATFLSAFFAINQHFGIEFFYKIRYFFDSVTAWGDSYYILRPPGLAYTSIQLSVTILVSICLYFYQNSKNTSEIFFFNCVFVILLVVPFLITAKILVIINFFVLLCYFFIKNKKIYNNYFVSFVLIIYLFFLSSFVINNMPQYARGITEKLGLISINFENEIQKTVFSKISDKNQLKFEAFKKKCKLNEIYRNQNLNCENLVYKDYLVIKKNVNKENLLPVFLNYGSHNSNVNALVFGGLIYLITTILFKLVLLYKTLSYYIKTRELDFLISFSFLLYLETYSNFHNAGLSTLSILYVPFYFLIFLQILYKKNFINK